MLTHPFGDADVEAFASDMSDVDVCGIGKNVVGKVNGVEKPNVVMADGIDNGVGLYKKWIRSTRRLRKIMTNVDEVDGWTVVVDDEGTGICVDVDVINTTDGVVLGATDEEEVGGVWEGCVEDG